MKRILLSITGTVFGLVALLSFKSHSTGVASALPAAALPNAAPTTSSARPPVSSGAPPRHTPPRGKESTSSPAARTVLGQAVQTQYGVVQAKITLRGSKITNATFAQLTAYDSTSQYINSQAAPILLQQTMSAQSARIDGVSGASYTSQGYQQSLQSALDRAGVH